MICLGSVPAGTTIYVPFTTYVGSTGASVTCSGLAITDIEIYKNGSTTQRSSDAGYTLLDTDGIDFDSITGLHGFSIDLSNNTDSGFFAVGSWYWVVVSSITVDGQTVTFLAAVFRIGPAESVTGYPKGDIHAINGSAAAATNLGQSTKTILYGTTQSSMATTTSFLWSTLNISPSADDQMVGRVVTFLSDTTTVALRGHAAVITSYDSFSGEFTLDPAMPAAPVAGDTFTVT